MSGRQSIVDEIPGVFVPDSALTREEAAEWMGEGGRVGGGAKEGEESDGSCSGGGEWGLFLKGLELKGWDTTSRVLMAADAWRAEWGPGLELDPDDDEDAKTV